jgi:RNA polymerase sigma factor
MYAARLHERVNAAKSSIDEINKLIEEYKPFIVSCAEKTTGRYIKYGVDIESGIALEAFAEAIGSFDPEKGSFLSFSQRVISRRLIDYFRKQKKITPVISLDEYNNPERGTGLSDEYEVVDEVSIRKYLDDEISEYRRLEIDELRRELIPWKISFEDLVKVSPKHKNTKVLCGHIIKFFLQHDELMEQMQKKKYFPVQEIEKGLNIPRKRIERIRKYIIAAVLVKTGGYDYLSEYISF